MLKLEIDWAGDEAPTYGDDGEGVRVEPGQANGPGGGWPTVVVYANDGPTLWSWLVTVYGVDGDEASELASMADAV